VPSHGPQFENTSRVAEPQVRAWRGERGAPRRGAHRETPRALSDSQIAEGPTGGLAGASSEGLLAVTGSAGPRLAARGYCRTGFGLAPGGGLPVR
jgi:hypothetical protein